MNKLKRDSFIFYRSFYEAINDLPETNQLEIYKAICELSLNFKDVKLNGLSKTIFKLIKPQIDANNQRFENGLKGGPPKGNQNATKKQPKNNQDTTKKQSNINVNENDNVNVNENENDNVNNNIAKYCEYNWRRLLTSTEINSLFELEKLYGYDEVKKAIDISCEQNALRLAYVKGILVKKPKTPNWMDKDIKKQDITNEEKEELERILDEFK